jgi:hypothetical protein
MGAYLKAGDTISGQEAIAKITIKQPGGGSTIEDLFYGKKLEGKCDINKTGLKVLGKRGEQNKTNGWKGSGTMSIYYITSIFREMAIQYIKTGIPVYFDILVANSDPGSTVGTQTTVLKNCKINSAILAKFDVDAEVLDEEIDFTFDDADLLDQFNKPVFGTV